MKPQQCWNGLFWHFLLGFLSKENSGEIKLNVCGAIWFQWNHDFSKRQFLKNRFGWLVTWSPVPLDSQMSLCPGPLWTAEALPAWGWCSLSAECAVMRLCSLINICTFGPPPKLAFRKPISPESSTALQKYPSLKARHNKKMQSWCLRKAWRLFYH